MLSLSVIIPSYNSRDITQDCLLKLKQNFQKYSLDYEVVVVDNGSTDGSPKMLTQLADTWKNLHLRLSEKNLGFTGGNNLGYSLTSGKYLLFLNSDVMVDDINFNDLLAFLDRYQNIGALTVKLMLNDQQIDPASHRGFPTIWRSFCYFFKLEKIFQHWPILGRYFGGYHLVDRNLNTIHEIDSPTGAFLLTRKEIFAKIKGFDEDFFMYGEDLDLSYRIKELGYKIIYYPLFKAYHLKGQSGINKKHDYQAVKKTRFYFYDAWRIFYKKHFDQKNNWLINQLIYLFIDFKARSYHEENRY